MVPAWLHELSWASLALGALCALAIAADELKRPQHMWIMNIVWPVTALFGTIWIIWQYFKYGRSPAPADAHIHSGDEKEASTVPDRRCERDIALWGRMYASGTSARNGWCMRFRRLQSPSAGAVCSTNEYSPSGSWTTFSPMRSASHFSISRLRRCAGFPSATGIVAAVKADTFSLTAWQVGMYGFMAIAYFLVFRQILGAKLETSMPEFWFMMQIAMLCGFCTSYPVNWWLLQRGMKEPM